MGREEASRKGGVLWVTADCDWSSGPPGTPEGPGRASSSRILPEERGSCVLVAEGCSGGSDPQHSRSCLLTGEISQVFARGPLSAGTGTWWLGALRELCEVTQPGTESACRVLVLFHWQRHHATPRVCRAPKGTKRLGEQNGLGKDGWMSLEGPSRWNSWTYRPTR